MVADAAAIVSAVSTALDGSGTPALPSLPLPGASPREVRAALRPEYRDVVETREPADRAWVRWNRAATHDAVELAGVGTVEDLGLDTYIADGGRYRNRRHAAFEALDGAIRR